MTPTKLLLGQILIVFAIVLAGLWASTQWIAAQLAYQPQLGAPWAIAFGHRVYHPWALFAWWYHFDAYAPHVFNQAGLLAGQRLCRLRSSNRRLIMALPMAAYSTPPSLTLRSPTCSASRPKH